MMDTFPDIEQPVVDFFLGLQRSLNAADSEAIAAAFAAELLLGDPDGTRAFKNDAALRNAIDERLGWLRAAGLRDAKALQIDPIRLGPDYALVKVRWSIWFMPAGRTDFVDEFLVDYVVRTSADTIEIAAALAHDTVNDVRRRIGSID